MRPTLLPPVFLRTAAMACALAFGPALAQDATPVARGAEGLRAQHAALREELERSPFRRPLLMKSTEQRDRVSGEVHALVPHPFAKAGPALDSAERWCDILILHLNTKYCRPSKGDAGTVLNVIVGRKHDQPLDEAFRLPLSYRVAARDADYLQVRLEADEGPLGTRDYRILLEAVPTQGGSTFIRLSYSYSYGSLGRMAAQAYLGTSGRDKVGFTVSGMGTDGTPTHVGGLRGLVERNTMRYYLAVESFLGSLSEPPGTRVEKSFRDWISAVDRYPRQLHEMERDEYLAMKRREYARQRSEVIA